MTTNPTAKIEQPRRKRVTFRFEAGPESDVCLAGSFNNWNVFSHPMSPSQDAGSYVVTLMLPVGRHEYKFFADGEWRCDPTCVERTPNGHGTWNNVMTIR